MKRTSSFSAFKGDRLAPVYYHPDNGRSRNGRMVLSLQSAAAVVSECVCKSVVTFTGRAQFDGCRCPIVYALTKIDFSPFFAVRPEGVFANYQYVLR